MPGLGQKSARRIVDARAHGRVGFDTLERDRRGHEEGALVPHLRRQVRSTAGTCRIRGPARSGCGRAAIAGQLPLFAGAAARDRLSSTTDRSTASCARRGGRSGKRMRGSCRSTRQSADLFAEIVQRAHRRAEPRRACAGASVACAGADELDTLLLVHSSAAPDRHRLLLAYIRLTLAAGRSIAAEIARPDVLAVRKIRDRVSLEIARFLGFVRFRRVGGDRYYAPVSPDADIVGFIGPHFAERFPDQALIIHDVNRGVAFWSSRGASGIVDLAGLPPRAAATGCRRTASLGIEELWRSVLRAHRQSRAAESAAAAEADARALLGAPGRTPRRAAINKRGDVRGAADSLKESSSSSIGRILLLTIPCGDETCSSGSVYLRPWRGRNRNRANGNRAQSSWNRPQRAAPGRIRARLQAPKK